MKVSIKLFIIQALLLVTCAFCGLAHATDLPLDDSSQAVAEIENRVAIKGDSHTLIGTIYESTWDEFRYGPNWSLGCTQIYTSPLNNQAGAYICQRQTLPGPIYQWEGVCYGFVDPSLNLDSDGDGLPDSEDMYPNDPTPYMVKMVTYFTADGTATGPHVGEIWVSDRGDYFQVGEIPDSDSPEWKDGFFVPAGTWVDPKTNDGPNMGVPNQTNDPVIEQPEYKTGAPTGDVEEGTETTGKSGTESTGSETDNQALHGIQDNTAAVADNTKRQLDYMKDLNRAIQNMDRNLANIGGSGGGVGIIPGGTGDSTEPTHAEKEAEAEEAEDNLTSVSVTDHYSGISGELTEGEDYELPGELAEESFIIEFFSSNPLIMAFENSRFESSGSTATASLSLGDLGSHQINLNPLRSGFQTAGNLLFGLCSIGALIIVVRG